MSACSWCVCPPRIIYSPEKAISTEWDDSIEVMVTECDIISPNAINTWFGSRIEITNRKTSDLYLLDTPALELRTGIQNLSFSIDTVNTVGGPIYANGKKEINLYFNVEDSDGVTYKSLRNGGHKLFLTMDLKDEDGVIYDKKIILIPIKTKKM